ncbi:anthranilate phosphoribosyltransferase [Megasphaera paucivorans]|uniref:Anthranilate phosphoribosyltransferase n=1 Tax=Megasphaera paucivorans TaxID=349095 RepID=A0A1G9VVY7_9FIRM|nr:anthranilate phosphoribosyltransferase [Megasphaera paucivorans]SDM76482.1 anthranilate phosphoribosyltransferase [Megasphaera paucivorans]
MLKNLLVKLAEGNDLTSRECVFAMDRIMDGRVSNIQLSAFLAALAVKGCTDTEITGFAQGMREHSLKVEHHLNLFEIVGTGGDTAKTFNISTTAAFVIAAGGVLVAKHGNRAKTSRSGSADMLEALGGNIFLEPDSCLEMLRAIGICYFYTRYYYYMMKHIDSVREELGIPTIFDVLRPLTNPARAKYELLGVNKKKLVEPMARVLSNLGVVRGMVVYGQDGSDEISASAVTTVCEFTGNVFKTYEIRPEDFCLSRCRQDELAGSTPKENAAIARSILKGEKSAKRTAIIMNAGAGLYICGKALTLEAGMKEAARLIDSGKAMQKMDEFLRMSQQLSAIERSRVAEFL